MTTSFSTLVIPAATLFLVCATFTTKGAMLFAIALDWPSDGKWIITSLVSGNTSMLAGEIKGVELLGGQTKLNGETPVGLVITAPLTKPGDYAFSFRITGDGIKEFVITQ